jgi:hypothetical protein
MRLALLLLLLRPSLVSAQTPAIQVSLQTQAELCAALSGEWTGVLEYRDYSEPASSTQRVQLPAWLTVKPGPGGLVMHFVYDDGPGKVVDETLTIALDVAASTYTITNDHGRAEVYTVDGFDRLRGGRGDFLLLGPTIDNGRPAESRISFTVRRNLLSWTEENRPTSAIPFAFRHRYTFTRSKAPAVEP